MNAIVQSERRGIQPVLVPQTFDQLVIFADMVASSGMVPREYAGKPGAIMVAVQMGSELGLSPMQAIQSIAVINGRPGVWGDGLIGLCRASAHCQDIVETIEGSGDERVAICSATRRGSAPVIGRFSVDDAKRAGLWQTEEKIRRKSKDGGWYEANNDSPWFRYPDRMLAMRARSFALRDAFPDVLRGLKTVEELRDYPVDDYRGVTLDARAERVTVDRRPDNSGSVAQPPAQPGPPKQTVRMWLDKLRTELDGLTTEDEVAAAAAREDVRKALDSFKNGGLAELNAMLAEAMARVQRAMEEAEGAVSDEDLFPGDIPLDTAPAHHAGA